MPVPDIFLQPDQIRVLEEAAADLAQLRQIVQKARRAGLDVADLEAQLTAAETKRAGMLREFQPPVRPVR